MDDAMERLLGVATVRRLREVVGDRADAVVAVVTPEGELLWASAAGSRGVFGRELEDFAGRSMFDYIHPEDVARVRRDHRRAAGGETVRYAVRGLRATGDWRPVSTVAWSVETASGVVVVSVTVPESATSDVIA